MDETTKFLFANVAKHYLQNAGLSSIGPYTDTLHLEQFAQIHQSYGNALSSRTISSKVGRVVALSARNVDAIPIYDVLSDSIFVTGNPYNYADFKTNISASLLNNGKLYSLLLILLWDPVVGQQLNIEILGTKAFTDGRSRDAPFGIILNDGSYDTLVNQSHYW